MTWRRGFVDAVTYRGDPNLRHRKSVGWLIKLMTTQLEPFTFLRTLDLSHTDITDLTALKRFPHLTELRITGCEPTRASLEILHEDMLDLQVLR